MSEHFDNLVNQLPMLLKAFTSAPPKSRLELSKDLGIYVFYENDKPLYFGITNNLKLRIKQHSRPSSGHNSATFAFILAKESAVRRGIKIDSYRGSLERDEEFFPLFIGAKERVAQMSVRTITIADPIMQTVFELYAAVELNTLKYNSFDNH